MFYRKVVTTLKEWAAEPDRKPLILKGARQVGKTTAVDIFSKREKKGTDKIKTKIIDKKRDCNMQ